MDGYVVIGTEIDTKGFDKQIKEVEYELQQIDYELSHKKELNLDSRTVSEYEAKAQKLGNQLERLRKKQDEVNKSGFSNIQGQLTNIGNGIEGITKKVLRWGLAVFGIRSAYLFVRQAMSTLSQYNEQLASNIEYIRYALANTLAPVIQWIINLVVKLLSYINYIAQAWFGVNLFANSSAKAFKDAKDSLGKSAKSAKEIKKQLAGFDEMNVLQDNTSNAGDAGAGGAGTKLPSFDLSNFQGEIPEWLKWIVDHKDEILAVMTGVAAGLLAWKMGLSGIQSLGIGIAIGGIVYAVEKLLDYLKDPSLTNLGGIIQGIGIAVIGLGVAFFGLPAIIAGVIVLIIGTVVRYWEEIKAFLQGIVDWLKEKAENIGGIPGMIIKAVADMLQNIIDFVDLFIKGIKDVLDGIIKFVKSVFSGDMKGAIDGLLQVLKGLVEMFFGSLGVMWSALIGLIKTVLLAIVGIVVELVGSIWNIITGLWNTITGLLKAIASWIYNTVIKPIADFFAGLWNGIVNGVKTAFNSIKNVFNSIVSFFKGIINSILGLFKTIGTNVGNVIGGAFKGVVNGVLKAIETILNTPIKAINGLIKVINKIPGVNLGKLNTFNLPRLAKGGIVNMPGGGVPVGGAIAGERGAEGVIPLTDSQQMALLGEAIGRYITVNANITNTMNGRIISRELQRVQNDSDFAYNR